MPEKKLEALDNLSQYGIKRVALSAIIVRNFNERVIGELIKLADRYSDVVRYIHFRSAVMTGRWADTVPYTAAELTEYMRVHCPEDKLVQEGILDEIFCTPEEGNTCCFRFKPTRRLQISIIEFASEEAQRCPKRGKLLPDNFIIQPFFENMVKVGNVLADNYGEVKLVSHIISR